LIFPLKCPGSSGEIIKDKFRVSFLLRLFNISNFMKSKSETISKSVKLSSPKLKSWICFFMDCPIVMFSEIDSGAVFKSCVTGGIMESSGFSRITGMKNSLYAEQGINSN